MEPIAIELWQNQQWKHTCKDMNAAFMWLLDHVPYSTHHATRYEGWRYVTVYIGPLKEND